MFSKAKTNKSGDDRQQAATAADMTPPQNASSNSSSAAKRSSSMKAAGVPSIISADMVINGNINSAGEVQLDGVLDGDIKAGSLIVGEKAAVKGEIICEKVTVRGRVEGSIRARQVALASSSHIEGDILHSALSVESGAHFEGNCRHSDDPLSDAAASDFRKARPASPPAPAPGRPVSPTSSGEVALANGRPPASQESNEAPSFLSQGRSPLR